MSEDELRYTLEPREIPEDMAAYRGSIGGPRRPWTTLEERAARFDPPEILSSAALASLERIVEERQAERRQCVRDAWRHYWRYAPTGDPDHPCLDGHPVRDALDAAAPGWRQGDRATLRYQELPRVREEWATEAEQSLTPAETLPVEEAALLREGGFTLAPLDRDEMEAMIESQRRILCEAAERELALILETVGGARRIAQEAGWGRESVSAVSIVGFFTVKQESLGGKSIVRWLLDEVYETEGWGEPFRLAESFARGQ